MDVVEKIGKVKTGRNDSPVEPVLLIPLHWNQSLMMRKWEIRKGTSQKSLSG